MSIVFLMYL